jgi:rubrerythrin
MMQWVHRWVWKDAARRARKLMDFAETEADGGRDLIQAAELTKDATLRRLYLLHAADEERHAALFRSRGTALLRNLPAKGAARLQMNWVSPGERGLDDLRLHNECDASLLAFLHLSEKAAAAHFAAYVEALQRDPQTSAVFQEILHDETFHMNYTLAQLTRVAPRQRAMFLWRARLSRLWKAYLRIMSGIAGILGAIILTLQYFILLPPFAYLAKRAERREAPGWKPAAAEGKNALESQY